MCDSEFTHPSLLNEQDGQCESCEEQGGSRLSARARTPGLLQIMK